MQPTDLHSHSIMLCSKHAQIQAVVTAALDAADPRAAVHSAFQRSGSSLLVGGQVLDLGTAGRVLLVGAGKGVLAMASGIVDILGDRLTGGVLIAKHAPTGTEPALPDRLTVYTGEHPIPGEGSLTATRAMINLLETCSAEDLVFCVISGGGSALMTLPQPDISLESIQELTRHLLASGATIAEINCLRKHLDQVKGGGLARIAHPARLITLILSDVVGAPLDAIASGPTVADPTTYADALAVLDRYPLNTQIPGSIRWALEEGQLGFRPETIKPGSAVLERALTVLVGSNEQSALAAVKEARQNGFETMLLTTFLQGEASVVGEILGGVLRQCALSGDPLPRPACIIAGGETTVVVRGNGLGGRNLEVALGAVELLADSERVLLITLATDGEDGPTDAAGAVVNGQTLSRARALDISPAAYLRNNDAYHFFEALDDLILLGPTGTNVNDLVFLFAW